DTGANLDGGGLGGFRGGGGLAVQGTQGQGQSRLVETGDPGRRRRGRQVIDIDGAPALGAIDVDVGAIGLEVLDILGGTNVEALEGEGCLGPGPVETGHVHTQGQVLYLDLNLVNRHSGPSRVFQPWILSSMQGARIA